MDTEPVNPFESPRAEDPLPLAEHNQPAWRLVLIGLLIAPLARPLFFVAYSFLRSVPNGLRAFLIAFVFSYLIALPAIAVAAWLHRKSRLTPLSAFLAWGWIPLVWGVLAQTTVTYKYPGPTFVENLENLFVTGFSMELPFIVFALYLVYLRRRDQKRGHELRA